jgi:hypothetical protein
MSTLRTDCVQGMPANIRPRILYLYICCVKIKVQNMITMLLLCGIETWPLALWEERSLSAGEYPANEDIWT